MTFQFFFLFSLYKKRSLFSVNVCFFVLIVQMKVVRRVGWVPPHPPPTTTTLKSCDDNFYFLQKQKVYIQFKKKAKKK